MTTGTIIYLSGAVFFTVVAYIVLEYLNEQTNISFFKYTDKTEGMVYASLFGLLWELSVPIVIACGTVYLIYYMLKPIVMHLCDILRKFFHRFH